MLVVSYFTRNGTYPEQAERLVASCERFGLRKLIQEIPDKGSWHQSCNFRVKWLFEKLIDARESILYMDCDCEVKKLPDLLFGTPVDFAAYNFAADPDPKNRQWTAYNPERLLVSGGVLYFAYTAPALELIARWISALDQDPATLQTDPILDLVYNVSRIPMQTLWLPKEYNRLNDRWPNIDPVIDHHYLKGGSRSAQPESTVVA
jgi:hypothetical protein